MAGGGAAHIGPEEWGVAALASGEKPREGRGPRGCVRGPRCSSPSGEGTPGSIKGVGGGARRLGAILRGPASGSSWCCLLSRRPCSQAPALLV